MATERSKLGYAIQLCDFFSTIEDALLLNSDHFGKFKTLAQLLDLGNTSASVILDPSEPTACERIRLMLILSFLSDRANLNVDNCHKIQVFWLNLQSQSQSQTQTQTQTQTQAQNNNITDNEEDNKQNNDDEQNNNGAANYHEENNEENNDKKDNFDLLSSFDDLTGDVFTHFCNYLAIDVILLKLQRINRQFYCMIDKLSFWHKYRHNKIAALSMKQIASVYKYRSELYCYTNGNLINLRIKYEPNYYGTEYRRRCKTEKELEMEKNLKGGDNELFDEKARKCYFWLLLNDSPKYQLSKYKEIFCGLKAFKFPYEIKCFVNHLPLKWFYPNSQNSKNSKNNKDKNSDNNTNDKNYNNSNNSSGINIGSIGGGRDLDVETFTTFCTNYDNFYKDKLLKKVFSKDENDKKNKDESMNGDDEIRELCGKTVVSHVYNFKGLAQHLLKLHKLQNQLFLKIGPKLKHSTQYDVESFDTFFKVFHNYIKIMHFVFGAMDTQENGSILTYFFDQISFINPAHYELIMNSFIYGRTDKYSKYNYDYYNKHNLLPTMEFLNFLIAMNNDKGHFIRCCNVLKLMFEKKHLIKILNWTNSVRYLRISITIFYNISKGIYNTRCIENWNDFKGIQLALNQIFFNFNQLERLEIGFSLLRFKKHKNDCLQMLEYFHKQIVEFMLYKNVVYDNNNVDSINNNNNNFNSKLTSLLIFYQMQPNKHGKIPVDSSYEPEFNEYNKNRTRIASLVKSSDNDGMKQFSAVIKKSKEQIEKWCQGEKWMQRSKNKLYQRFDFEWRI